MITLHNESDYKAAMVELDRIWHLLDDDGDAIDREWFDHLVDAIIEYEDTHFSWEQYEPQPNIPSNLLLSYCCFYYYGDLMNEKIKSMLTKADFIMWDGESWAPKGAIVDWNADYTVEMTTFITDLVMEAANVAAMITGTFNDEVYYGVVDHFTEPDRDTNDFTPYEPTEIDEWSDYDKDC